MPKDTHFLKHDYNARNDLKLARIIQTQGMAGIGIYWCLVEMLYEEGGQIALSDIPAIAKILKTQVRSVEKVIRDYGLFEEIAGDIRSLRVIGELSNLKVRSEAARDSARARWKKDANAMRTQCERNAPLMLREDKIREDKNIPPVVPQPEKPDAAAATEKPELKKLINSWENIQGGRRANEIELRRLADIYEQYTPDAINHAFEESVMHDARTLAYIEAVLEGRKPKGGNGNGINRGNSQRTLPTVYENPDEFFGRAKKPSGGSSAN